MKKLFGLLLIAIIALSSCADSKTFERADGTKFVAEPYGWANYQTKKIEGVSEERIREELTKCFKCNSSLTLGWLSELTDLRDYIFKNTNLWLKPTSEK